MAENFEPEEVAARKPHDNKRSFYVTPQLRTYGTVAEFTKGSTSGTGETNNTRFPSSDPALKEAVVRIGTHPLGVGIYLFDYKTEHKDRCGHGRQFGLMADEVSRVMPEAIGRDELGFMTVNYARLGVTRHS